MIVIRADLNKCKALKEYLANEFKMKDFLWSTFLGLRFQD